MSETQKRSILHVSSPLSWRGGEQQLFYLYLGLKSKAFQQIVFCPQHSELSKKIDESDCVTYKKRSGFDIAAAFKLAKLCKAKKVDLIHCHDAHAHTTAVLAADIFGNKVPIVLSRRVDFHIGKSWFSRHKYNHKRIVSILCVSDAIKEIVRPAITNANIRVVTVHSGVDVLKYQNAKRGKLRKEFGIPEGGMIIGNVAAMADHKDIPTFLRTVKRLQSNESFYFFLIGSGPLELEMKAMASELQLTSRLIFTGFRNDLTEIFCDLDVLLFTSKTEGLGTTILDAFANKVPVVATNAGGISEMIHHLQTGLLCEVGDDEQLANAVLHVLENAELNQKLIENALEKLKQFSWTEMVAKTQAEYHQLFNN